MLFYYIDRHEDIQIFKVGGAGWCMALRLSTIGERGMPSADGGQICKGSCQYKFLSFLSEIGVSWHTLKQFLTVNVLAQNDPNDYESEERIKLHL